MSYAIAQVVFGVPLTEKVEKHVKSLPADCELFYEEGWETAYQGGGYREIGYCGVEVHEFDECNAHKYPKWDELNQKAQPTQDQRTEAYRLFHKLDPVYRELLAADGITDPYLFIVWSSS